MKYFIITLLLIILLNPAQYCNAQPIIIGHNCTNLNDIPESFILQTKSQFRIAYGHTSHGSQIVSGMNLLKSMPNSIFTFNQGNGSLYLNDAQMLTGDLGNPDRSTWATKTRNLLNNNSQNINTIMWSWCGQVDGSESDINTYLGLMNQLEQDFPEVKFVYMTGHLNGSGVSGNVNVRNEQIRKFCRNNNKILFDFADIESYDPDGKYFLDQGADDACNYNGGNWADEWCQANPGKCSDCSCAHSKCLNCQQKGKAFWWMMARIAGWDGNTTGINEKEDMTISSISPNPASEYIEIKNWDKGLQPLVQDMAIKIYNTFGELVMTTPSLRDTPSEKGNLRIDISHLPIGLYFIQIGNYSEKFVVVR